MIFENTETAWVRSIAERFATVREMLGVEDAVVS